MEEPDKEPLVSVIIPTYNSQESIEQCLDSIKRQTYERIEVLVVDRHSADATTEIARRFKAKVLLSDCERSEAKNHAARNASGQFLLFIDSDMELNPKIVEECVRECAKNNVQAVIIPEEYTSSGLIGECQETEKKLLLDLKDLIEIPRFFRKNVFMRLGVFDEELVCGEDFHIFRKFKATGYKVGKIEARILHLERASSFYDVVFKAYNYGKSLPSLIGKLREDAVKRYAGTRLASAQKIGAHVRSLKLLSFFLLVKMFELFGYFSGLYVGLAHRFFVNEKFRKLATGIREKSRILISLSLFTLIAIIIFRNFLFTSELPAGNDVFGWISRKYIFSRSHRWLRIWRPYSFGFVEGVNLIDLFFMLINLLFVDANLTIKLFLFSSFLLAGFSMYAFVYSYTRSNVAAISATMIYTLNHWFFSQLTEGHVDIVFSYAFAPLLFLLVDRALRKGKLKYVLSSAVALTVFLAGFHPNYVVIYGMFLTLFLVIYITFPVRDLKLAVRIKNSLKFLTICCIMVFLLAAFFTAPFFMNIRAYFLTQDYKYPIEEAIYFSAANPIEAFALGATEEGGYIAIMDIRKGFGLPDFPVQTFPFFVFLVSYSAILVRRDRYTTFFLIAALASTFISKGPNPPVGDFFTWAWFNISYFAVFRRPNRWEAMTAFSNAFFVALFVSLLSNYIKKPAHSEKTYFSIKMRNLKRARAREFYVSVKILNKWAGTFRKISRFTSIAFMVLIFLSGFVSCWFFFSNGLLTYKVSQNYIKPFQWIAEQNGQFKIITTNKSPEEWVDDPNAGTDFAFCRMRTEIGWAHDLGFDSSIFHDKPVLQDGGWEPASKGFVDYLRRRLVYNNMTDDLLKILGLFNYRYVVFPSYGSERVENFFLSQQGIRVVYNESDSVVVENGYFTQQIFSPKNFILVLGGLEAFSSLCKIDSFNLNETALLFINSGNNASVFSSEELNSSRAIVFANGASLLDAALSVKADSSNLILARDYAVPSMSIAEYWVKSTFWRDLGKLVLGGETLTTRGECKAVVPFSVRTDGDYEVWVRIAFATDRGRLSLYVDDEFLTEVIPEANYWTSLKWVKMATLNIKNGHHTLTLHNDGNGYNDVDALCIVEKSVVQSKLDALIEKIQAFDGRLVYMLQPEDLYGESVVSKWTITPQMYEGNVLVGENAVISISPEGNASASSTQFLREEKINAKYTIDANLTTRWASSPTEGPPQWLQINWTDPKEIIGVKVVFERAYARGYLIQTWDEENSLWLTQTNATENDNSVCLHIFEKPVDTTKLRVYITEFSDYPLTSIWELEAYEKSTTATSMALSIPRDGYYQCFLRANSTLGDEKIYLKLGENTSQITLFNCSNSFQWFDIGVFHLNASEQKLNLGVLGNVGISQILLVSLSKNENNITLPQLFAGDPHAFSIEYERIDPCTYKVHVNATEPFLLVFSESYNPLWKALVEDEEIHSFPAYSIVNGFFINRTVNSTITIYFTGQTYVDAGLRVALASFVFTIIVLLTPSEVSSGLVSRIKSMKKVSRP